jgi:signal transduction histidine kinase
MDFGFRFEQTDNPSQGLGMISKQERARLPGGAREVKPELGRGTAAIAILPVDRHE